MNIAPKLNDPATELKRLRCAAGKISPIIRNGIVPNPIEYPIINTIRLTSGRKLLEIELCI